MSKNNLALLNSIIEEYTLTNFSDKELNKDQIFEVFATDFFFNKYDFSIEDIKNGLIGGKKDWGIDGFYILIKGKSIKSIEDLEGINLERNFNIDLYVFQYKNIETIKHLYSLQKQIPGIRLKFVSAWNLVLSTDNHHTI